MKTKFITLFVFSLILDSSISSVEPSSYSKLLGNVRTQIVEQCLLNLPKRNSVNYLKMVNLVGSLQEKYSLTEAETAYLIYKWIATNIEVEQFGENDDPIIVYNEGKGTAKGISSLFKQACNYLKIEADTISGYLKTLNINDLEDIINKIDFTWNYILIDGSYYLIDVSSGAGMFDGNNYQYTDFFFGTNPEYFIRLHFPKEDKWQLLSEPYSLEQFESQAYLSSYFYVNGLKSISPDTEQISGDGESKIVMTYDSSFHSEDIMSFTYDFETDEIEDFNEVVDSNGKLEIIFKFKNVKTFYLGVVTNNPATGGFTVLTFFKLNYSGKNTKFLNLKKANPKHSNIKQLLFNLGKKNNYN